MAKILREKTLRLHSDNHYICTVILDVADTEEGYCVEFYSEEESTSTSFGASDLGYRMATMLYEALVHCCEETLATVIDHCEGGTPYWDREVAIHAIESEFWTLMHERFESGWLLCDESTGEIQASNEDFIRLTRFIGEWF